MAMQILTQEDGGGAEVLRSDKLLHVSNASGPWTVL